MKKVLVVMPASDAFKAELAALDSAYDVAFKEASDVTESDLADVQILVGNVPVPKLKTFSLPSLEWVQLNSAGYDNYIADGVLPEGTIVTNAGGSYGPTCSEHMIAMAFMLAKKLHLYHDNMQSHAWADEGPVRPLHGNTVIVLGMGAIGQNTARIMKALGNTVIGVRRNTDNKPDYIDQMITLADLDAYLPSADFVLCCLPSSPSTTKVLGAKQFALMKDTAILCNVGRGSLIDTDALVDAVHNGQIAAAGIDVTDPEPLPADHAAWKEENILITPHVSGGYHMPGTIEMIYDLIISNLKKYAAGEALDARVK